MIWPYHQGTNTFDWLYAKEDDNKLVGFTDSTAQVHLMVIKALQDMLFTKLLLDSQRSSRPLHYHMQEHDILQHRMQLG